MYKALIIIALMLAGLTSACFAQKPNNSKDPRHRNYVGPASFNGNKLIIDIAYRDTIPVEDPGTGEITYMILKQRMVTRLNGRRVYNNTDKATPPNTGRKRWEQSVTKLLRREFRQSRNYLEEIWLVIDEKGKPAYVDVKYWDTPNPGDDTPLDERKKTAITRDITRKLSALRFTPARKDGRSVPYCLLF